MKSVNFASRSNFNQGSFSAPAVTNTKLKEFCLALYESKSISVLFRKTNPDDIEEEQENDYENFVSEIKNTGKLGSFTEKEIKIGAASLFVREMVKEQRREEQYVFEQGWEQAKIKYRKQILDSVDCYSSGPSHNNNWGSNSNSRHSCHKSFDEDHDSVGNWEEQREAKYGINGYETK